MPKSSDIKLNNRWWPFLGLIFVAILFFYKSIFWGLLPFPGDLLISEYKPWQSYSFLGYNPGSYPNKAQYFDTIRQTYPWRYLATDQLKHHQLPLWNPYNFAGSPLLANIQTAVFYPLNLILFVVNFPLGWSILVIFQPLLASIFMFLFMKSLKIGDKGAFISAVAFGYSLFMSVFLEYNTIDHVILWLPLGLYCIEKILDRPRPVYYFLFVISIVMSGFAGHIQIFAISVIFMILYLAWRLHDLKSNSKIILIFGCIILIAFGITAIQYIPALELIQNSARSNQPYDFLINVLLFQPKQLLAPVIPDLFGNPATRNYLLNDPYPGKALYIGIVPLIMALITLSYRQKTRLIKFFSVIPIVLFFCLIHTPVTAFLYKLNLPFISTSSPTNSIFIISFCLSVLAGLGFEFWQNSSQIRLIIPGVILTLSVIFLAVLTKLFHL
jgi:hypothetical protein